MTPDQIIIRPALPDDLEALSSLAYRSKKSNGYDETAMERMRDALEFKPSRLTRHRFWVAQEDNQIIGCIALETLGETQGAVRSFFTAPEHKGRGIGKRLWFDLLTVAQCQGITRLCAEADPASVPFYESLGFKTDTFEPSRSLPGENVPRMSREI